MPMTRYLLRKMQDHELKTATYTPPTHIYVALFTATPSKSGGGTEVSGTGYARQICDSWSASSDADVTDASNSALVDWGTAGGAWGVATHFGLFDALTAGNLLRYGALETPRTIESGDPVTAPIGDLHMTLE